MDGGRKEDVDRFLSEKIETIPHLEALLLIWNSRPKQWRVDEMAARLFLAPSAVRDILDDLARENLIATGGRAAGYKYPEDQALDGLFAAVDATYRKELIRVTRLIHAKPSAAVRAFARAFRLKKEDR